VCNKKSSKPDIKGSRVEGIEEVRKEYKILLNKGWKKKASSKANSKVSNIISNSNK
tara:strand:+ start:878 stop:1045 length:168 start_codon:yes stop_codon:yes gene_type:complete